MVGTLFNTFAVAVGASAGLALGARWSSELKDKMFVVLGLFTLAIGSMMALETAQPIDLFLALVFGTLLGHSLKLQARLSELTQPKDGATAAPSTSAIGSTLQTQSTAACHRRHLANP